MVEDKHKSFYFIYQQLKLSHEPFAIWKNPSFWKRWMEINITENTNKFTNPEDFYFTLLIELVNCLSQLNFEIDFKRKVILDTIAVEYLKNVKFFVLIELW